MSKLLLTRCGVAMFSVPKCDIREMNDLGVGIFFGQMADFLVFSTLIRRHVAFHVPSCRRANSFGHRYLQVVDRMI